jgi:hypothetical protein
LQLRSYIKAFLKRSCEDGKTSKSEIPFGTLTKPTKCLNNMYGCAHPTLRLDARPLETVMFAISCSCPRKDPGEDCQQEALPPKPYPRCVLSPRSPVQIILVHGQRGTSMRGLFTTRRGALALGKGHKHRSTSCGYYVPAKLCGEIRSIYVCCHVRGATNP